MIKQSIWQSNFRILWIGSLITDMGNAMTLPFLVLFIQTLGHFDRATLNLLAALAFSLTYLSKAIVSPLWGHVAEQYGRKPMCLRASGMMAFTILMAGLSPNVLWLLCFRILQGAFSGYINNANALIATSVPSKIQGRVLSKLVTGSITGTLIGPLIGGILASWVGYRGAFFVTSGLTIFVFVTTLIGVHEDFTPVARQDLLPLRPTIQRIGCSFFFALFGTFFAVQFTISSITPLLSLLVQELIPGQLSLPFVTGLVAAMPGLATILVAGWVGMVVDRLGPQRSLLYFLSFATICLLGTAWIQHLWQLVILRFLLGIADAALLPALQIMTVHRVPKGAFSRVFSFNQTAQSMGNVIGPTLGAVIASATGYRSIFVMSAFFEGFVLLSWLFYLKRKKSKYIPPVD